MTDRNEIREMLKNETKEFQLNESVCPECFGDVEITDRGTLPAAHYGKSWDGELLKSFSFKCKDCGSTFYMEQTQHGDWVAN